MRRVIGDAVMSAGALALLLLTLVAIDPRVRDQAFSRHAAQSSEELLDTGARARAVATAMYQAAREQTEEHTALTIFVVAGVVLVVFMIRT